MNICGGMRHFCSTRMLQSISILLCRMPLLCASRIQTICIKEIANCDLSANVYAKRKAHLTVNIFFIRVSFLIEMLS